MTLKTIQRAGRLQEEGCLEYGEDDSWTSIGSYIKRPLACQEVSFYNQRNSVSLCNTLVQSNRFCGRKVLGRKNNKTESLQSIPNHIRMGSQNDCVPSYILALKQKECKVRQGSTTN